MCLLSGTSQSPLWFLPLVSVWPAIKFTPADGCSPAIPCGAPPSTPLTDVPVFGSGPLKALFTASSVR